MHSTLSSLSKKPEVRAIIFTDIATDRTLQGPNIGALQKILARTRCHLISSGGVADIEDIKELASLPNLSKTIIGKALYNGTVDLEEAVAVANYHIDAGGAV